MAPGGQTDGKTDGLGQNYIPPPSAGGKNLYEQLVYNSGNLNAHL